MDIIDTLSNVTDGLGRLAVTVGNVFDNGLEIYGSYRDRLRAINIIQEETVLIPETPELAKEKKALTLPKILSGENVNVAVIAGAVILVALGVLISKTKK